LSKRLLSTESPFGTNSVSRVVRCLTAVSAEPSAEYRAGEEAQCTASRVPLSESAGEDVRVEGAHKADGGVKGEARETGELLNVKTYGSYSNGVMNPRQ
jgi:hypothetical protein